ncbi:MAG TPA: chemotaxis protein CheB, partial [Burkholderiales bacterium]|nr:chemotaxis protein CheB [Burkholderiales bacterium]
MDVSRSAQIRLTIGVGASAGGLAALKTFVRSLPTGAGFAVVVIQHLDPDSRSMLSELLDKHSVLPVLAAKDGQRLEADTVYVIPPDCYLSLNNGVIRLSQPKARRGLRKTVDHFFVSLAENCGARCAAIVMSGTGSDGTEGLAAVKVNGGLTIAQEPSSAEHASMPTSAIGAAVIDAVVPIEQMSELLENFVKSSYSKAAFESSISAEVAGENLAGIVDILRERENFDLGKYKPRTMQRRITRRMNLTGTSTYAAYLELLKNDAEERSALTKDLLINVTDFFRDPEAFQILESEILPAVLAGASDDRPIRVWVPGCASGEEA